MVQIFHFTIPHAACCGRLTILMIHSFHPAQDPYCFLNMIRAAKSWLVNKETMKNSVLKYLIWCEHVQQNILLWWIIPLWTFYLGIIFVKTYWWLAYILSWYLKKFLQYKLNYKILCCSSLSHYGYNSQNCILCLQLPLQHLLVEDVVSKVETFLVIWMAPWQFSQGLHGSLQLANPCMLFFQDGVSKYVSTMEIICTCLHHIIDSLGDLKRMI